MKKKYWHAAFCGATKWELKENKKDLSFESEHELSQRPIKVDMLVVKKNQDAVIKNEIGRIFRGHNIIEFKGSGDSLNIDDYYKTLAYASLYKSLGEYVNEIPAEEVTVTILREAYPRELFSTLRKAGTEIEEKYKGIFYLSGKIMFPTQVIVTKELSREHSGLKILSKAAKKEDVENFLEETVNAKDQGDRENIDAILQVSVGANRSLYSMIREGKEMCTALEELMADVIEEKERKAKKEARITDISSMMETLKLTAKQAMDALKIPESEQQSYMKML